MKVKEVLEVIEEYAPLKFSDEFVKKYSAYDNSGIIIDNGKEVTGIAFSLDLTFQSIDCAEKEGCNLIITHHPAIYKPILNLSPLLIKCVEKGISVISMHLNLDCTKYGIDYYFAKGMGGENQTILYSLTEDRCGYGRVFDIGAEPFEKFVERFKKEFNTPTVFAYGEGEVKRVASFCGGGLDADEINEAYSRGVDLIVSADIPHHLTLQATELGIKILNVTHYSSEIYGFKYFYEYVSKKLKIIKTNLILSNKLF